MASYYNEVHIYFKNNRKMKKLTPFNILLVFSMLIPHGCREIINNNNHFIVADLLEKQTSEYSDLFSHVEIVPLETTRQSLIRSIRKLVVYNDVYYIFDYNNAEILMFDMNGKYLSKISDMGGGPHEYVNISDFEIDGATKTVRLLAAANNSIYEYNLEGDFKDRYKLPEIKGVYKSLRSINADTITFFTFDFDNRIKFYSKRRNKIIKEFLPEKENILDKFSYNEFSYSNYLHRASTNTLFIIDSDCNLRNGYTWDFGSLNNTKNQLKKINKIDANEIRIHFPKLINSEIINQIIVLHGGNSKYFFAQLWRKGNHLNIFHDRENNRNFIFRNSPSFFNPLLWNDEYVVGYYENPEDLNKFIPDISSNYKSIRDELSEFDNPVLIKYYFEK